MQWVQHLCGANRQCPIGRGDAVGLLAASLPNRVFLTLPPGQDLPVAHPAHGKTLVDGGPAAYVCDGPVCSLPLTEPRALSAYLAGARA